MRTEKYTRLVSFPTLCLTRQNPQSITDLLRPKNLLQYYGIMNFLNCQNEAHTQISFFFTWNNQSYFIPFWYNYILYSLEHFWQKIALRQWHGSKSVQCWYQRIDFQSSASMIYAWFLTLKNSQYHIEPHTPWEIKRSLTNFYESDYSSIEQQNLRCNILYLETLGESCKFWL